MGGSTGPATWASSVPGWLGLRSTAVLSGQLWALDDSLKETVKVAERVSSPPWRPGLFRGDQRALAANLLGTSGK